MALVRPTDTDEALVARTAKGDMDAYSELYKRYHAVVRAYARRRTGDMDRADELTQEIFLDAWRSADRYDPKVAPVAAWLRTITARRAVDWTRRAAVRPPLAQHEGREIVEDSLDNELVDRIDFTDALKELPEAQRETLALAFYGDLTYPEIAERTNTPLGTVTRRALLGLRRPATSSVALDARPNMAQ
ncbi:MAG: RNA polymerase sigma factor [Gaiellales bacterium]